VTGASQGIGAGLVKAFLDRGYNVVANSRNITKTNPFSASANLALVDGDISDPNTATKIADTAVSRFDRIDALVNNAGIFFSKQFTDYTVEDLRSLDTSMHKNDPKDFLKKLQPMGQIADVKDIVDAIVYLTEARQVTGEVLHVDGGAHVGKW